jgi:hypothetical protein
LTNPILEVWPIAKPDSSTKRIYAATGADPVAFKVCIDMVRTAFMGSVRRIFWPMALTVTTQRSPLLIAIGWVWVTGPSEVRLTVPEEAIPAAVTLAIVVLSLVPLV